MKRSYIYIAIVLNVLLTSSLLYSYSRELVCVLPFAIEESLLEEYRREPTSVDADDTDEDDIGDKYSVVDGIPRLLIDEINSSKMLTAINYELMIALLNRNDSDNEYTQFSRNVDRAREILEPIFLIKYIVYGNIKEFNATIDEGKTIENAKIDITINVLNLQTNEIITLNITKENVEAPYRGLLYQTHDAYFFESALGKALESGLKEVSDTLVSKLEYSILEATVIRIADEPSTFYINMGKNKGVKPNDVFDIYKQSFLFSGTNNSLYENILTMMNQFSVVGNITTGLENQPETLTNIAGDVRYTSDMLANYLKSITINEYIGKAKVVKAYENFSEMKIYITTNEVPINTNYTNLNIAAISNDYNDYINTSDISNRVSTNIVSLDNSYTNLNTNSNNINTNNTTNTNSMTNISNANEIAPDNSYSNTNRQTYQIDNSSKTNGYIRIRPEHATNFSPELLMKAVLYKD